jgi:hypothetical protein
MPKGGYRPSAGRKRKDAPPLTPHELEAHRQQVEAWRKARQPDHELRAALAALDVARCRVAATARRLVEQAATA